MLIIKLKGNFYYNLIKCYMLCFFLSCIFTAKPKLYYNNQKSTIAVSPTCGMPLQWCLLIHLLTNKIACVRKKKKFDQKIMSPEK